MVFRLFDWYSNNKGINMAKNTSVTLGNHFDSFICQMIEAGRYSSAREVIRAGLRILDDSETKLQNLRGKLIEGEECGLLNTHKII